MKSEDTNRRKEKHATADKQTIAVVAKQLLNRLIEEHGDNFDTNPKGIDQGILAIAKAESVQVKR